MNFEKLIKDQIDECVDEGASVLGDTVSILMYDKNEKKYEFATIGLDHEGEFDREFFTYFSLGDDEQDLNLLYKTLTFISSGILHGEDAGSILELTYPEIKNCKFFVFRDQYTTRRVSKIFQATTGYFRWEFIDSMFHG